MKCQKYPKHRIYKSENAVENLLDHARLDPASKPELMRGSHRNGHSSTISPQVWGHWAGWRLSLRWQMQVLGSFGMGGRKRKLRGSEKSRISSTQRPGQSQRLFCKSAGVIAHSPSGVTWNVGGKSQVWTRPIFLVKILQHPPSENRWTLACFFYQLSTCELSNIFKSQGQRIPGIV